MKSLLRWLARAVVLAAAVASLHGALRAAVDARSTFRYARRHSAETLEVAQDRLFGSDYMDSIRAVRQRFGARDTVYFIDDGSRRDGSTYFALFHLAPRRLTRFPALDHLAEPRFQFWLPRPMRTVLVVPNDGEPVQLIPGASLRPGSGRARQARP